MHRSISRFNSDHYDSYVNGKNIRQITLTKVFKWTKPPTSVKLVQPSANVSPFFALSCNSSRCLKCENFDRFNSDPVDLLSNKTTYNAYIRGGSKNTRSFIILWANIDSFSNYFSGRFSNKFGKCWKSLPSIHRHFPWKCDARVKIQKNNLHLSKLWSKVMCLVTLRQSVQCNPVIQKQICKTPELRINRRCMTVSICWGCVRSNSTACLSPGWLVG